MSSISLKNVTKIYANDVRAVDNLSFEIEDNEFIVLVGPSGCGKSTVLRMIAGLEDITEGDIYLDRKRINDVPAKDRDIAMVFQNYALYPHMTIYENMAFGLKNKKIPKDEIRKRINEAAAILNIGDLFDRRPKELSGGQSQRAAVGRAIVRKPKIFLFDEPLSNLDAKLRVQMRVEISKLYNKLNTTMLYVTHDQIEAMTLGSKIIVMDKGIIKQIGSPLDLYNNPQNKFVARFIGNPAMNIFKGNLYREGDEIGFSNQLIEFIIPEEKREPLGKYNGKEVILGIRPEDLAPSHCPPPPNPISNKHPINIDVVEPVGNEIFTYFSEKNITYCMRVPSSFEIRPQTSTPVIINADKIYFFDSDSGLRIA